MESRARHPLPPELLAAYNEGRQTRRLDLQCLAPSSNMYFNMFGQAAPCWLSLESAPRYPDRSIRDIWFGEEFEGFRSRIAQADLSGPCQICERNITNRVFTSTLARAYDNDYPLSRYPSIMEFELSNTCNLECIMCKGTLSSTIRRDRDGLPPMQAPYDDAFVDQLEEFIPHLKEARFNGGEPLLQRICWEIWRRMHLLNPAIEITLATNATVLNDRAKRMLENGRFRVNVSLDSLSKPLYESIRINAVYEETLANLHWLGQYCARKGTLFSIMVNPMRNNWREMPEYVRFCAENGYRLWFNTVWRPFQLALWNLESLTLGSMREELSEEIERLERKPTPGVHYKLAMGILKNFVDGQLRSWAAEQAVRESEQRDHSHLQKTRERCKEEFLERLQLGAPAEVREKLLRKVELLERRVARNVPSANYYYYLLDQPFELVLSDLHGKSVEHLVEWVYMHDGYY